ncbi:MAG: N-6 DNA methylase [Cyanobacteria bacterium MAG CAR2_bin_4]|nr:N-6 DNA methylase [Cyanobacteria bacterium MAG CAR2_bin_4]MCY4332900.1 N-6 DNA methylase [Cyanobacteria bacterium MAG CAR1_bin_15]
MEILDNASQSSETHVQDFISGAKVRITPEEVHAVQVFAKILVNDYGYPKEHLQTRPQWRVKVRPSDTKRGYPIDISVFDNAKHTDDNLSIIVECKRPNRRDGRTQLEDYLRFSRARIGVWFNGKEKLFLKKTEKNGRILFEDIPNIPKFGERLEDVGLYCRRDLIPAQNLKSIFKTMRNYLVANAVGITRDEVFASQIINLIFCKIYDERFTKPNDMVSFRAGIDEPDEAIRKRIKDIFAHVKRQYADVIESGEEILLDDASLSYAVGEIHLFCLIESERDAIAEAFEVFIGPSLKGSQGQFFTPRHVVHLLINMINLNSNDRMIDPACGSGGFLVEALREMWKQMDVRGEDLNWPVYEIFSEKQKVAISNIRGIDKDYFLAKVAKAYMAIIGDGRGGIFCENSLDDPSSWRHPATDEVRLGTFDVVLTNPPFGKKLKIDDQSILKKYKLAHKWTKDSESSYKQSAKVCDGQSPQILFIERCLALLKPGGRLGIIVPESMFCNPSHRHIIQYVKSVARIKAVVSFPEELFQPFTHAKVCGVLIEKTPTNEQDPHDIFMAVAKWCGHDSRGLPVPYDDIPRIIKKYDEYIVTGKIDYNHFGFALSKTDIVEDIYLPKYYNPEIRQKLETLKDTHYIVRFGDMIEEKILEISTGHEVGKLAYGTGSIPFIRSSDIANWEIKLDPKHGLSVEIYEKYKERQNVQTDDILMVRDGTYLVGTCAIISSVDTRIVYQSHIYKIRINKKDVISPGLLLAILSSPIVREQIYAKRFTQDIIDTLGGRIHELILPIPKDEVKRQKITCAVNEALSLKQKARALARNAALAVAPDNDADNPEFLTLIG